MTRLALIPCTLAEANAFVVQHHRRHGEVRGHKFSLGAVLGDQVVGVAMVGRPVSRERDDGATLEITRLCTDGVERKVVDRRGKEHDLGVCSFLYGAAARATFALGYRRIGTYIAANEPGVTLCAAGWRQIGATRGGSWTTPSRPRVDRHPLERRLLFEASQ